MELICIIYLFGFKENRQDKRLELDYKEKVELKFNSEKRVKGS